MAGKTIDQIYRRYEIYRAWLYTRQALVEWCKKVGGPEGKPIKLKDTIDTSMFPQEIAEELRIAIAGAAEYITEHPGADFIQPPEADAWQSLGWKIGMTREWRPQKRCEPHETTKGKIAQGLFELKDLITDDALRRGTSPTKEEEREVIFRRNEWYLRLEIAPPVVVSGDELVDGAGQKDVQSDKALDMALNDYFGHDAPALTAARRTMESDLMTKAATARRQYETGLPAVLHIKSPPEPASNCCTII